MSQSACSIALIAGEHDGAAALGPERVVVHLRPERFDSRRIAADDHSLGEVLDHSRRRRAAEAVGDRRFADAGDALVGHQLDDDRMQLARRDEVDVDGVDFHRELGREGLDNYSWRPLSGVLSAPARSKGDDGGAVPAGDRSRRRTGRVDGSTAEPVRGAARRPAHHRDPAAPHVLRRFEFGPGCPCRLLPDGGVPGLLGAACRRTTRARLLDSRRAGNGRRHRRRRPWLSRSSSSSVPDRRACAAPQALARAGLRPIVVDEPSDRADRSIASLPAAARTSRPRIYGFEANEGGGDPPRFATTSSDTIDYRPRTLVWNVFGQRLDLLAPEGQSELAFDRLGPRDRRHGPGAARCRLDAARRRSASAAHRSR